MKQNQDPWTMHKPRSYNWTKRTSRTMDGVDSDYMTVFDVATGAVVQEGDIESPRKRIKGDDGIYPPSSTPHLSIPPSLIFVPLLNVLCYVIRFRRRGYKAVTGG